MNALSHKMASSSEPKRAAADRSWIEAWLINHGMLKTPNPTSDVARAAIRTVVNRASRSNDFATLSLLAQHGAMTPKMYAITLGNIFRQGLCREAIMDWFDARIPMTVVAPYIDRHSTWLILHYPQFQGFHARYASPEIDSCLLLVTLSAQRTRDLESLKRVCRYNIVTRAACLARNGIVLHKTSRWRGARRHVFRELIRCCRLSPADLASVGLKWPKA